MFDTLHFYLTNPRGNYLESELMGKLGSIKQRGENSYSGWLDKVIYINIKPDWIYISCSLPKVLTGQNVEALSLNGVESALQLLTDKIGFNVHEARVHRLDIGATLEMDHSPHYYMNGLLDMPRLKRFPVMKKNQPETVYFKRQAKKNSKELRFYDKGEEANITGNLLRYELVSRDVSKHLKHPKLTIEQLIQPRTYYKAIDWWEDHYKQIWKADHVKNDYASLANVTAWKRAIKNDYSPLQHDLASLFMDLESGFQTGRITKGNNDKIKAYLKRHATKTPTTGNMQELDQKIMEIVEKAHYSNGIYLAA